MRRTGAPVASMATFGARDRADRLRIAEPLARIGQVLGNTVSDSENQSTHRLRYPSQRFLVPRTPKGVGRLNERIEQWLPASGAPLEVARTMCVCIDELLANVVMHGSREMSPIDVNVVCEASRVIIEIIYRAESFDPTRRASPETTTPLPNREVGGLGIHLVRNLTNVFQYRFEKGQNHIRIEKNF